MQILNEDDLDFENAIVSVDDAQKEIQRKTKSSSAWSTFRRGYKACDRAGMYYLEDDVLHFLAQRG